MLRGVLFYEKKMADKKDSAMKRTVSSPELNANVEWLSGTGKSLLFKLQSLSICFPSL